MAGDNHRAPRWRAILVSVIFRVLQRRNTLGTRSGLPPCPTGAQQGAGPAESASMTSAGEARAGGQSIGPAAGGLFIPHILSLEALPLL